MQTGLHDFLARIARTIAMTLVPVAFIAFVTMPAAFTITSERLPR